MAVALRRAASPLPGFGLSLGVTLLYLGLVILIPLSTVFVRSFELDAGQFWKLFTAPRILAAFRLSFLAALAAAGIDVVGGILVAWVLVRYRFPGRALIDGLVDLPFALPTAVAGITLATLYAENGWIGGWLGRAGIKIAYTPAGIVLALAFIGLPFVVRSVQPILRELDPALEEAASSLGARRFTVVRRVLLPEVVPALATGFVLALARGLGEYGSVIFIAGNLPMKSEIVPLLIMIKLEQYEIASATAIAAVFLVASFALLLLLNSLSAWRARRVSA